MQRYLNIPMDKLINQMSNRDYHKTKTCTFMVYVRTFYDGIGWCQSWRANLPSCYVHVCTTLDILHDLQSTYDNTKIHLNKPKTSPIVHFYILCMCWQHKQLLIYVGKRVHPTELVLPPIQFGPFHHREIYHALMYHKYLQHFHNHFQKGTRDHIPQENT